VPKNQNVKNAGLTGVLRWKARAPPEVVIFFFRKLSPPPERGLNCRIEVEGQGPARDSDFFSQAFVGGERRVRVYASMYMCMDACGE
jgi:hypothetical protein